RPAKAWMSRQALASEPKLQIYLNHEAKSRVARAPSGFYNAMIAPLTPYRIRGVIWYQGESNAENERDAHLYRTMFPLLIEDWRSAWHQGRFSFLFVQLANMTDRPWWPLLRESQAAALKLSGTAAAITLDVGDPNDGHPKNKQAVGARLALAARAVAYGESIVYSGPTFREMTREDQALRIWFNDVGGGLIAQGPNLAGFKIAGPDRRF